MKEPGAPARNRILDPWLFGMARLPVLVLLAGVPVVGAAWLLLSPGVVLVRFGPMDFLFNLAGAWQLAQGRVAHVDFHEHLGQLNFWLTALGFRLVGPTPYAFLVGETIVLAALFAAAVAVARSRLPLAAAVVFVLFCALQAVIPVNTGSELAAYGFAMSYNRYGWSGVSILSLILFVPPRRANAATGIADMAVAAGLLAALFHLKITYFAAGLGALALALAVSGHVRARRKAWAAVGLVLTGDALAPWNWPYLADLWNAVRGGQVNAHPGDFVRLVFNNGPECALLGIGMVAATWMWRRGLAPLRVPAAAAFLTAASLALLSQNAQSYGMPLGAVVAFVLYDAIARRSGTCEAGATTAQLGALLILPAMWIGTMVTPLLGYRLAASRPETLQFFARYNLQGLAIPAAAEGVRRHPAQAELLDSLVEAADLFAAAPGPVGRILTFHRINPLPFMLGVAPPRGGYLWWEPTMPVRPAEDVLGDVDHVLVPRGAVGTTLPRRAMAWYADYLDRHFPYRLETANWTVLSRQPLRVTGEQRG